MRKITRSPLKGRYSRILVPEEDGSYSAELLEFPGCVAQGSTPAVALRNLELAAADWIRDTKAQGGTVPGPLSEHGFSGAVSLRLPRSLHRRSMQLAARDRTSLNQYLVSTIAARSGAEDFFERLCEDIAARLRQTLHVRLTNQTVYLNLQVWGFPAVTGQQPSFALGERKSGTDDVVLLAAEPR